MLLLSNTLLCPAVYCVHFCFLYTFVLLRSYISCFALCILFLKGGLNGQTFSYFESIENCYFSYNFDADFFFELIVLRVSGSMSVNFHYLISLIVSEKNLIERGQKVSNSKSHLFIYLSSNFHPIFC